jgi:pilus assembly protein Flp/PilA
MQIRSFVRDEGGATAIEYGLIAALIFVVILVAVGAAASQATNLFNTIATHVAAP